MKALVVAPSGEVAERLSAEQIEVVSVGSLEEGESLIEGGADVQFAVVDESVPFAHAVILKLRMEYDGQNDRDRLPVLVLTGSTQEDLRCDPDVRLGPGVSGAELVAEAKRVLHRRARQRRLFEQELALKVATSHEGVDQLGDIFERLVEVAEFSLEDQVQLATSIREAIGNAAEHGNKHQAEKTIHINFVRTASRFALSIRDEGGGFDTGTFMEHTEENPLDHTRGRRDTETRPGGLGKFIMIKTCDELTFNQQGNCIFLAKDLPGPEGS